MTDEILYRFRLRRGADADLIAVNEVPLEAEIEFGQTTGRSKTGDGVTPYNDLLYTGIGFFDLTGLTANSVMAYDATKGYWTVRTPRSLFAGVTVLVDAATIAIDASLSDNFRVTLGGNRTLGNPTNLSDGQTFNIRILQDGTGGRTLAYGSMYKFPGGVVPTLSTAASARDFMSCQYDATNGTIYAVLNKAFG